MDITEAEAIQLMVAIGFIVGGFVGAFYVYNTCRYHGLTLSKLVTEKQQEMVKQVILQEEVEIGFDSFELDTSQGNELKDAYLPPLTAPILEALGLGRAHKTALALADDTTQKKPPAEKPSEPPAPIPAGAPAA